VLRVPVSGKELVGGQELRCRDRTELVTL
jgi:hypothetical protein